MFLDALARPVLLPQVYGGGVPPVFCILLEMGSQVGIYSELAQNQVSGGVADLRLSCLPASPHTFPTGFLSS